MRCSLRFCLVEIGSNQKQNYHDCMGWMHGLRWIHRLCLTLASTLVRVRVTLDGALWRSCFPKSCYRGGNGWVRIPGMIFAIDHSRLGEVVAPRDLFMCHPLSDRYYYVSPGSTFHGEAFLSRFCIVCDVCDALLDKRIYKGCRRRETVCGAFWDFTFPQSSCLFSWKTSFVLPHSKQFNDECSRHWN